MTYNPLALNDTSEAMLSELIENQRHKLFEFERRMERHKQARQMDGDFNICRLLTGLRENNARQTAPYEMAWSDRIAESLGRQPEPGYAFVSCGRDLTTSTAPDGGFLVGSETAPGATFIKHLNALIHIPIQRLRLVGNALFPGINTTVTSYWVTAEGTTITPSQFGLSVAAATPKSVAAYMIESSTILKQMTPATQQFVFQQMAAGTAAELYSKLVNGTGASGQPLGILNTSGIASVAGAALTYPGILDLIEDVEGASGITDPSRVSFLLAPNAARLLRTRATVTNGSITIMSANTLQGYPAEVNKAVPDGCLLFADWSQLVLLEGGVLQVGTDPYGADGGLFKKGAVAVRSIWDCDLVLLHRESFGKIQSIT